jgi:Holliday junction DNA helicase RuvA
MIAYLRGTILEKDAAHVVLDVGGVGYQVQVASSTAARMAEEGSEAVLYICESVPLYGGATALYGFASREDKLMFLTFKELKATGAKKALEYLDKAAKSLPDFRRAILDGDTRLLTDLFGFTRKTAEKLISGLQDKLGSTPVGQQRIVKTAADAGPMGRALEALAALGYKPGESRTVLEAVRREWGEGEPKVEDIIRQALRKL